MTTIYRCVKLENHMTIWVGSGRSAPRPWNIWAKVGMTKIIMKMITRTATDDRDRVDHRALDLALQLGGLLDVAGQPLQDDVEDTSGLTDGEHVDEEIVEHLRILLERLREGGAALDFVRNAGRHRAQGLGVALLRQNRQALSDREAGVDHRGELARVDREVLVLDGAADLLDGRGLGLPLLNRRRDDAFGPEPRDGPWPIVGLDLADDDSPPGSATIRQDRHGPLLTRASAWQRATRRMPG